MKDLFFMETHDNIRIACAISFQEILENCFVDKKYQKDKPAKELIFGPLFEELQGQKDGATRQSACFILRKLTEIYMDDPEVVDISHCLYIVQMGIKNKISDRHFLMCLFDLINHHGPTVALGKHLTKAIQYFISSVKFNMAGTNAINKAQRD